MKQVNNIERQLLIRKLKAASAEEYEECCKNCEHKAGSYVINPPGLLL
jgi:hypothetical protein